jgi:hypothetical protein
MTVPIMTPSVGDEMEKRPALSQVERRILMALDDLQKNHGMTLPDEWREGARNLAAKGLAEQFWGFWYLTASGRSHIKRLAA